MAQLLAPFTPFIADEIYENLEGGEQSVHLSDWPERAPRDLELERDMRAPAWPGAPVWIHGDLSEGNLLLQGGRLSGVIDFGGLAAGDPATTCPTTAPS